LQFIHLKVFWLLHVAAHKLLSASFTYNAVKLKTASIRGVCPLCCLLLMLLVVLLAAGGFAVAEKAR
jgi:hypothetical protein